MLKIQKIKKWGKIIVLYFIKQIEKLETDKYLKSLLDREGDLLEIIKNEFQKPAKIISNTSRKKDISNRDSMNMGMDYIGNIKNIEGKRNIKVKEIFNLAYLCLIAKSKWLYEIL
jgi:hypothetical protein